MRARAQFASYAALLALAGCSASGESPFFDRGSPYRVVDTVPRNAETGVPVDLVVEAEFGGEIDGAILPTAFRLLDTAGNAVPGTVSYADRVARFDPQPLLSAGASYRAVVEGLSDELGRPVDSASWIFTTRGLPASPIAIAKVPADGRNAVPTDFLVRIAFNVPLDPLTVSAGSLIVEQGGGGAISGQTRYDEATRALVFEPIAAAPNNTQIQVTVSQSIRDIYGRTPAGIDAWTFGTGNAADGGVPSLDAPPTPVETPAGEALVQLPGATDPGNDWPAGEIVFDAIVSRQDGSVCGDPFDPATFRAARIGNGDPLALGPLEYGGWQIVLEAEDGSGRRSGATAPVAFTMAAGLVRFDRIAPILEERCALAGCHDSAQAPGRVDLTQGAAALTSAISSFQNMKQVEPFCLQNSYLYRKIRTDYEIAGEIMPPPGVDVNALSRADVDLIRRWIEQGAQE